MWRPRQPEREPVVLRIDDPSAPHWWCGCRRLADAPDCTAAHADGVAPARVALQHAGWAWLCGCGASARWPHCDGSHRFIAAGERPVPGPRRIA